MPTATVLVTGVSGFIAKHCAVDLLNHGYRVRGTVRSLAKSGAVRDTIAKHADPALLEFAEADLMSDKGWAEAMNGVDGVLHVASPFIIAEPKHPDDLIKRGGFGSPTFYLDGSNMFFGNDRLFLLRAALLRKQA